MAIKLGKTARYVRKMHGLKQKEAAEKLGISVVHLSNLENDKAAPSTDLLDRYRECWGIDLYVLAWCLYGDVKKLPAALQEPMAAIADVWQRELEEVAARIGNGGDPC